MVTDTLPAGLEPVDLPVGCLATGQVVSCALGTLPPDFEQTIDVGARAQESAAGSTITNRVSIRSDEADLNPGNDTSSADLTVRPLPAPSSPVPSPPTESAVAPIDLAVTVDPPSGLATVGVAGTWTLRVVNYGPGTATNVTLTAAPRGAADLVGATTRATGCLTAPGIKCGLGTLAPGASRTVAIDLRPTDAGRLTLTGTVSAAEQDTVPPNDSDQAAVTVGLATIGLGASAQPAVITAGDATTISIKAVTRGRRTAHNATICVRLPKTLNITRPTGATLRRGRLCWRISQLATGRRRAFHLRAVAPPGQYSRTVVVDITVTGRGIHTRRVRLALHIRPGAATPPRFTG